MLDILLKYPRTLCKQLVEVLGSLFAYPNIKGLMDEKASYFAKYLGDLFRFDILNRIDKYKSEAFLSYTANVYSAYGVSAGFSCCGETL